MTAVAKFGARCERRFREHPEKAAELYKALVAEGQWHRINAIEAGDLELTREVGVGLVTVDIAYQRAAVKVAS